MSVNNNYEISSGLSIKAEGYIGPVSSTKYDGGGDTCRRSPRCSVSHLQRERKHCRSDFAD